MYEPSATNPAFVGEKGAFPDMATCGSVWFVSILVMARVLGIRRCAEEDFRFLLGPLGPALEGEAGRDRLRGVTVADVGCEDMLLVI